MYDTFIMIKKQTDSIRFLIHALAVLVFISHFSRSEIIEVKSLEKDGLKAEMSLTESEIDLATKKSVDIVLTFKNTRDKELFLFNTKSIKGIISTKEGVRYSAYLDPMRPRTTRYIPQNPVSILPGESLEVKTKLFIDKVKRVYIGSPHKMSFNRDALLAQKNKEDFMKNNNLSEEQYLKILKGKDDVVTLEPGEYFIEIDHQFRQYVGKGIVRSADSFFIGSLGVLRTPLKVKNSKATAK